MDRDMLAGNQQSTPQTSNSTAEKLADEPTTHDYPCSLSSFSSSSARSFLSSFSEKVENHAGDKNSSVYSNLPHLADLMTYMIQDVIRFSKSLQDFR